MAAASKHPAVVGPALWRLMEVVIVLITSGIICPKLTTRSATVRATALCDVKVLQRDDLLQARPLWQADGRTPTTHLRPWAGLEPLQRRCTWAVLEVDHASVQAMQSTATQRYTGITRASNTMLLMMIPYIMYAFLCAERLEGAHLHYFSSLSV